MEWVRASRARKTSDFCAAAANMSRISVFPVRSKLVNAMVVDGQVRGGTAQGIGTCPLEAMPFDAHDQPLASSLLNYLLPGASEVPPIRVLHMETPSPHTEFGVKGIGEGGAVGPPAAILCAVNDALRAVGAEVHDLPLTPVRIMQAISGGSASRS